MLGGDLGGACRAFFGWCNSEPLKLFIDMHNIDCRGNLLCLVDCET